MAEMSRQSIIQGMSTKVYQWNYVTQTVVAAEADSRAEEVKVDQLIITLAPTTGKLMQTTGKQEVSQ